MTPAVAQTEPAEPALYVLLLYRHLLLREPGDEELAHWTSQLESGMACAEMLRLFVESVEYRRRVDEPKLAHPPGHYYSPVVDPDELRAMGLPQRAATPDDLHGLVLDADAMRGWWRRNAPTLRLTSFPERPDPNRRYFADNGVYPVGDATVLRALLAERKPHLVIEIGSGFSTACMLDTIDEFGLPTRIVAVEPDPARLQDRLWPQDRHRLELIEAPVQSVPLQLFDRLKPGDILFVDSTHVLKTGSDVHHELFAILPRLAAGVLIHFHDIHYPFEYPDDWIFERRYSWNEVYALRAFLMHNAAYDILFMTSFFALVGTDLVSRTYSRFSINPGGSLWLLKK